MRNYELLLIVRPNLDLEAAVEAAGKVAELVQTHNGQVTTTKVWGRRKLAFPIDRQSEGTYILLNLELAPAALKEIQFSLKLNEDILRYMLVQDMGINALAETAKSEAATEALDADETDSEEADSDADALDVADSDDEDVEAIAA